MVEQTFDDITLFLVFLRKVRAEKDGGYPSHLPVPLQIGVLFNRPFSLCSSAPAASSPAQPLSVADQDRNHQATVSSQPCLLNTTASSCSFRNQRQSPVRHTVLPREDRNGSCTFTPSRCTENRPKAVQDEQQPGRQDPLALHGQRGCSCAEGKRAAALQMLH